MVKLSDEPLTVEVSVGQCTKKDAEESARQHGNEAHMP